MDPRLREGKTQGMRQWRMQSVSEIDVKLIHSYLEETIQHYREGREVPKASKVSKEVSTASACQEWEAFMKANAGIANQFGQYTQRQQNDFINYIGEAKRSATRLSRLEKIKPMILENKGLHDKYKNC